MTDIFISYVKEDSRLVAFLAQILRLNGLNVWLDSEMIAPGQRWKSSIRDAIGRGTYFLSIHSKQRAARTVSYVNEELVLAIDEIRRRPANVTWFVPIKIDDCEIESRDIGGGETLSDIQYCDLTDWSSGIRKLLNILNVTNPMVDLGEPLANGLPSFVAIKGGYLSYDNIPDMPEMMQGLEFRVAGGWCQRMEGGRILAYIETVAPMRPLQEINRQLGLSGFYAVSTEHRISDDFENATEFYFEREYTIPAGTEAFDFNTGKKVTMQIDFPFFTSFVALGSIDGMKFSGTFGSDFESKHPLVDFRQTLSGSFCLDFDPSTAT